MWPEPIRRQREENRTKKQYEHGNGGTDPSAGKRIARFIGVDGPRWFLRGVVGGAAATDVEAAAQIEDLFRSIVVVRGTTPMPPRDLIPLRMPATPGTA